MYLSNRSLKRIRKEAPKNSLARRAPLFFCLLALLICTGCDGVIDSDDGGMLDAGVQSGRRFELQLAHKSVPFTKGLTRGISGLYLRSDVLWRSADEGESWEVVYNQTVGDVVETSSGLFATQNLAGVGLRVVRILSPTERIVLEAPWDDGTRLSLQISILASGDNLWVEITGVNAAGTEVVPAKLWRRQGESAFLPVSLPADVGLWTLTPSHDGGLIIGDGWSPQGPYHVYQLNDDDTWRDLGGFIGIGDLIETPRNTILLQVFDADGNWRERRILPSDTPDTVLSQIVDGGRIRRLRPDGSLVRLLTANSGALEESLDDGLTWQALATTPSLHFVHDFQPLDDGDFLGWQVQYLTRFSDDKRWVLEGWPSGEGYEVSDVASVGERMIVGLANSHSGLRATAIFISDDAGKTFLVGPQIQTLPLAICGSSERWLVAGNSDSRGNSYNFLSADGMTSTEQNRLDVQSLLNPAPDAFDYEAVELYKRFGFTDLAFNRMNAIDCVVEQERVLLSIGDLEQSDGLLLALPSFPTQSLSTATSWLALGMPLDVGDRWPSPAALFMSGQLSPVATFSADHEPFFASGDGNLNNWRPSVKMQPGPLTPIAHAVADGTAHWLYSDGTTTDGEIALARKPLYGFPAGATLLGATGTPDGQLWVATSRGLYRGLKVDFIPEAPFAESPQN